MNKDQHQTLPRLTPENCVLLICDLQEKFRPAIFKFDQIVANTNKLIQGLSCFKIPIVATEQYPKGLGQTVPEIRLKKLGVTPVSKTCFTMALPEITDMLKTKYPKVKSVVLCGVEAHVCVQLTTQDFLELGYTVHVVVDCTSSRNQVDRMFAYDRMKQMGAFLNTAESVILSIAGDSRVAQFKNIQKIIHDGSDPAGLEQAEEKQEQGRSNQNKSKL